MRTIKVHGDPESVTAIMVPKTDEYKDHESVRLESTLDGKDVIKSIFRVVDGGEDQWELQFE